MAEVLDSHILPAVTAFAEAASSLADVAAADCTRPAVLPAYQAAFDAWTPIADIRLGPSEAAGLSIAFWPDERGSGMRALQQMLATDDPAIRDPDSFAQITVAARGFSGLDLLLGDPGLAYGPDDPACALVWTVSLDLAHQARTLAAGWAEHADLMRDPGGPGNLAYLDADERGLPSTRRLPPA